MRKKKTQCLMLKTQENKRYFTYKKNAKAIHEFASAIGAKLAFVEVEGVKINSLDEIASLVCAN